MRSTINGVKISAICCVVPGNVSKFEDEIVNYPFSEQSSRKLAKVMGFKEHRVADKNVTLIDLATFGLNYFFENNIINREEISALIFVSHQHEYPVPGNSKVLHGLMHLSRDTHCIDMYENCSGYISGLFTAASILNTTDIKNVILITSNSGTCYINKQDRNIYPLMGDAASVTLIQKTNSDTDKLNFNFHHDGSMYKTLLVPVGGMRNPLTISKNISEKDSFGNIKNPEDLRMDGANVFHYVMDTVPNLIDEICGYSNTVKEDIDYFITHQPNRFLVDKLTELLKVNKNKVFNNIVENFGNSSSSTIPMTICFNLGEKSKSSSLKLCLSAFGAGMSAAATICKISNLKCCKIIEYKN